MIGSLTLWQLFKMLLMFAGLLLTFIGTLTVVNWFFCLQDDDWKWEDEDAQEQ